MANPLDMLITGAGVRGVRSKAAKRTYDVLLDAMNNQRTAFVQAHNKKGKYRTRIRKTTYPKMVVRNKKGGHRLIYPEYYDKEYKTKTGKTKIKTLKKMVPENYQTPEMGETPVATFTEGSMKHPNPRWEGNAVEMTWGELARAGFYLKPTDDYDTDGVPNVVDNYPLIHAKGNVKKIGDRKSGAEWKDLELKEGNDKLKGIAVWSLPAGYGGKGIIEGCGQVCKGMTAACSEYCYAKKTDIYPASYQQTRVNLWYATNRNSTHAPDGLTFEQRMKNRIQQLGLKEVRVHESGDFFSGDYIQKWKNIATDLESKGYRFTAYTKVGGKVLGETINRGKKEVVYANFKDYPDNFGFVLSTDITKPRPTKEEIESMPLDKKGKPIYGEYFVRPKGSTTPKGYEECNCSVKFKNLPLKEREELGKKYDIPEEYVKQGNVRFRCNKIAKCYTDKKGNAEYSPECTKCYLGKRVTTEIHGATKSMEEK